MPLGTCWSGAAWTSRPIRHFDNGGWVDGKGGPWNSFFFFSDPDGNGWTVQEKPADA